ncbi:MAG: M14 family metallocarboxypeptidase [Acutalibacteraceae bacterium]|nr:M14 family metallocarboxypeptidase [Acutalibacteraceae bacterium]
MESIIKPVPYDYFTTRNVMYQLKDKFPFINIKTIGKSVIGKEILSLVIGKREQYVLIAASFHGKEWITTPISLLFAQRLSYALANNKELAGINARRAFYDRGLIIVPMVNPDGVDIAINGESACMKNGIKCKQLCNGEFEKWSANARGVDINHNFDAGWEILHKMEQQQGIYGPSMSKYGGQRPESEPETVALTDLCKRINFSHVMALHTQGEEIYWHYGSKTPEKSRRMANILSASSGYVLSEPTGTASHGGFKDWFINTFAKPGFTVEIGRGESPLPVNELYSLYLQIEEMLMLTLIM